jgi:hypothetical protein
VRDIGTNPLENEDGCPDEDFLANIEVISVNNYD